MRKISQQSARRYKKELEALQQQYASQRTHWVRDYPGGQHVGTLNVAHDWFYGALEMARKLGHPIVVVPKENKELRFYVVQ